MSRRSRHWPMLMDLHKALSDAASSRGAPSSDNMGPDSSAPGTPGIFNASSKHSFALASSMTPTGIAQPSASSSFCSTFLCKRCELTLPSAEEDPSRPGQCKKDSNSYKSISDRWTKNRSLRAYFTGLSDSQRVVVPLQQRNRLRQKAEVCGGELYRRKQNDRIQGRLLVGRVDDIR